MNILKQLCFAPLIFGITACSSLKNSSADLKPGQQTAKTFSLERKQVLTADYLLYLPDDYNPNSGKRWPMIYFLHGIGERGTNVWEVAKHGVPQIDTHQTNFPFIVVSPQCPDGKIWSNDVLLALLNQVEQEYSVDTNRIYLTGLSMGGFGAWSLGLNHPELFAAIAPVCGGGNYIVPFAADKTELQKLPIWAFHGAKDPVVPVGESKRMVAYLKKLGVHEVKLTIYPDALHDCWDQAYADPELYAWFLRHSRAD